MGERFYSTTQFEPIFDKKKKEHRGRGLVLQAHPDDNALGSGIIETLVRRGVDLAGLTLTDGGARNLRGISREVLVPKRVQEDLKSFRISGITVVSDVPAHVGIPDGELADNEEQGVEAVQGIMAVTKPEFIIVPHIKDPHTDHASAARIAFEAANGEIPVYMTDTASRQDRDGHDLIPTHVFSVSFLTNWRRNRAHGAHETQTTKLPPNEMAEVVKVRRLPFERGKEYGVKRAAVLYHAGQSNADPIGEYLQDRRVA